MAQRMKLGFIGLGNLGAPIAENLLESGHELYVFNRTSSKAIPLKAKGAIVCESISALAKVVDMVFTIVSDDAALNSIVQGKDGLLAHGKPGSIHISMSTILPETAVSLEILHEQHKQHYLAVPVFGRPEAARIKKLNFVMSGSESIREKLKPILQDAGAAGIYDFGEQVSAANAVKLCGNFMIAAAIESMGESISLAKQSGVDTQAMWNMFTQTLFNSPIYINYGNIILQQKFEPASFTSKLGLKDLNLVRSQAASVDQLMPLADLLRGNLQELVDQGKDQLDWSAMYLGAKKNSQEAVIQE
jgi:3-hydroxyisobutyrate dehydrogenase-like beta-hydroxyacid dehydrogenase